MPGYRDPTPEELETSRDVRSAARQLNRLEACISYLEQAARFRSDANQVDDPALKLAIERTRNECLSLRELATGRVESRRRPKSKPSADSCTVFLDECGQHLMGATDAFPVFVLAAVIVRDVDYQLVDATWKRWKHEHLAPGVIVHEPDVRRANGPFRGPAGEEAVERIADVMSRLEFGAVAVVFHREDFVDEFGTAPIDGSLPGHAYLAALDFLMERVVFALDNEYGGAKAEVVAESRGSKEDALLQYEFARLHLDGTSYVSPSWFRQQLHPGIRFVSKQDDNSGVQIADLLARPIGEKVAAPESDPARWSTFREKLCKGLETKHSIVGLKIVPWRERYADLWKS